MKNCKFQKVLIVDDNEMDLLVNKMILSTSKFAEEIVTIQTGSSALNYLTENCKTPKSIPDIILLDINMPVMNGFDFLKLFEELPSTITEKCKIIMVSSSEDMGDVQKAGEFYSVIGYMVKPIEMQELNNF